LRWQELVRLTDIQGFVANKKVNVMSPLGGRSAGTQTGSTTARAHLHYVVPPADSHTWGLFESGMQESWNTIGPTFGAKRSASG
jgi:hypothetical protein